MVDYQCKKNYTVRDLPEIVRILRGPNGCPWDQVQTHESIQRDFLEEVYEVMEAIERKDPAALKEELGDVLLQVAFHTVLEDEAGGLTLDDVADGVCKKLIYRHPHVFGEVTVSGTDEVLSNWEELKRAEKDQRSTSDALEAVARTLPALWRAEKVQKKTAKTGFDWSNPVDALTKLEEEVRELRQAVEAGEAVDARHGIREEVGDVLFIAAKVAQMSGVDPEDALHRACDKFDARFRLVEEAADKSLSSCTEEELLALWNRAKEQLS